MKTITIRLPDVEAAMLVEVQKVNRAYRDIQGFLVSQIQQEYAKTAKGRASSCKCQPEQPQCHAHHAICLRAIRFTSP